MSAGGQATQWPLSDTAYGEDAESPVFMRAGDDSSESTDSGICNTEESLCSLGVPQTHRREQYLILSLRLERSLQDHRGAAPDPRR